MYRESKNKETEELDIVFQETEEEINNLAVDKEQDVKKRGYKELVLNLFEKSPEIGRLLVRLHDRNKLYGMAKTPDELIRAELTQTVVDLLSFDLTLAEKELISDVLSGLISQAERNLRRAISERLSVMEGVPLRVVLKIASDEIFVADPMLKKSSELKDFDLIYILKAKGKEHWQSIAQRPQISGKVVDMLVDTDDLMTAIHLTKNKSINLTNYAVEKFFNVAKTEDTLAKPLLLRQEVSATLVKELYRFVGAELKGYIQANFANMGIEDVLEDVVLEFCDEVTSEKPNTTLKPSVIRNAEQMMEKGLLTPSLMLDNLKRGQVSSFKAQLSICCALPADVVEEILNQDTGQGLAIVCKAKSISKSDFINMFLLSSRIRGGQIIEDKKLTRAIEYYNKITEKMAKSLLSQQRH